MGFKEELVARREENQQRHTAEQEHQAAWQAQAERQRNEDLHWGIRVRDEVVWPLVQDFAEAFGLPRDQVKNTSDPEDGNERKRCWLRIIDSRHGSSRASIVLTREAGSRVMLQATIFHSKGISSADGSPIYQEYVVLNDGTDEQIADWAKSQLEKMLDRIESCRRE